MNNQHKIWLAAEYHLPSTYSCRLPFSSISSALISPAPGPATVRLALLRVGIELMGRDRVRSHIFPTIRALPILIRPPERIALSTQVLRGYKVNEKYRGKGGEKTNMTTESIFLREMAHAEGPLTIYIEVPEEEQQMWSQMLLLIGYWGQTDSFATCIHVRQDTPNRQECVRHLQEILPISSRPLQSYYSCTLTDFRDQQVSWEEIDPFSSVLRNNPLTLDIYLWPLEEVKRTEAGKLLIRSPLEIE